MHRALSSIAAAATGLAAALLIACGIDDGEPTEPIPTPDAGLAPATKAGLGDACKLPTDCESGQCFVGGQFSYCSLQCGTNTAETVCVPPVFNGVCNMRGFCKKP